MIERLARHRLVRAGVAAILLTGVATVVWAAVAGRGDRVRRPPDVPVVAQPNPSAPAPGRPVRTSRPFTLGRSTPLTLDVSAIGVHSRLLELGLNADGTVEVPPLGPVSEAGWYRYSPTPGQLGPAIILGHVDSAEYGPGVFLRLRMLRPGDLIRITRADRRVATFRVDRVAEYPKAHFPTAEVYGDTDRSALRLITCGGVFDPSAGSYLDNTVVYASLLP